MEQAITADMEESVPISVRIPRAKFAELATLAQRNGIVKASLIRSWIYEKLEEAKKGKAA